MQLLFVMVFSLGLVVGGWRNWDASKVSSRNSKAPKIQHFLQLLLLVCSSIAFAGRTFFRYRHAGEVPIRGGITNTPAHFAPNRYGGRVLNTAHGTAGSSTLLHFLLTALCYQSLPPSSRQAFAYFLSLLSLTLESEKKNRTNSTSLPFVRRSPVSFFVRMDALHYDPMAMDGEPEQPQVKISAVRQESHGLHS